MKQTSSIFSRRAFLCMTAAAGMLAAGVGSAAPAAVGDHARLRRLEERRMLGNLEVSAIGLGCLPMVGYYGGKFEKKDMIALIRYAFDSGVTFFFFS